MRCQILFSRKNKNIISLSSAESAHCAISVKSTVMDGIGLNSFNCLLYINNDFQHLWSS